MHVKVFYAETQVEAEPSNAEKTSSRTKYKQYFSIIAFKINFKIQIFEGNLKYQCNNHIAR
jgi:hypothetical protein